MILKSKTNDSCPEVKFEITKNQNEITETTK